VGDGTGGEVQVGVGQGNALAMPPMAASHSQQRPLTLSLRLLLYSANRVVN